MVLAAPGLYVYIYIYIYIYIYMCVNLRRPLLPLP